jgi:hypothetical protein
VEAPASPKSTTTGANQAATRKPAGFKNKVFSPPATTCSTPKQTFGQLFTYSHTASTVTATDGIRGNYKEINVGNFPRFFGKDASNLPQPTLFDMIEEAEQLIRLTQTEMEQLDIDLRFLLMMIEEYRD